MAGVLHGSACTTPRVRAELQAAQEATCVLAARCGLNPKTVAKWRRRTSTANARMGPSRPRNSVLTEAEEAIVVESRRGAGIQRSAAAVREGKPVQVTVDGGRLAADAGGPRSQGRGRPRRARSSARGRRPKSPRLPGRAPAAGPPPARPQGRGRPPRRPGGRRAGAAAPALGRRTSARRRPSPGGWGAAAGPGSRAGAHRLGSAARGSGWSAQEQMTKRSPGAATGSGSPAAHHT